MGLEIERKFLVKRLPENLENIPSLEIIQGYLKTTNNSLESRIRKQGDRYFYTIKTKDKGIKRHEDEKEIQKQEFSRLWESVESVIEKRRFFVPYEEDTIHLDVYSGKLKGLSTAEVEFPTIKSAKSFKIPEWFGEEVTDDDRYKNRNLAVHGTPK